MIAVSQQPDALRLPVRVTPKAHATKVLPYREGDGWVRVQVQALPEDGKANRAVVELFSDVTGLPKRKIAIASGETARLKILKVSTPQPAEVLAVLAGAMATVPERCFRADRSAPGG